MVNQFFLWYNCFQYGMIRHYFLKGRCYHDSWTDRLFYLCSSIPDFFWCCRSYAYLPVLPFQADHETGKRTGAYPYGTAASVLLCLLLKESFFTKKHLRFPDSIIVLWKQCTILRTVSSRHFILEHFLFFLSTILLLWYTVFVIHTRSFLFLWRR